MKRITIIFLIVVVFMFGCSNHKSPTSSQGCDYVNIPDDNLRYLLQMHIKKQYLCRADLEGLTELSLFDYNISSIEGLQYCINLQSLDISGNSIKDISPLESLSKLIFLDISYNNIQDINGVRNNTKLEEFYCQGNNIVSIQCVDNFSELNGFIAESNNITDISSLSGLLKLIYIDLDDNAISDISSLTRNVQAGGMGAGSQVYLYNNPLSGSAMTDITYLESVGANVYY